jgi:uncharacterized membrane protein YphA (DoxX/SURF4 family)
MSQIIQTYIVYVFQIILAVILINVWLVRFSRPTKYRGSAAKNMTEEFSAYGLPVWFMYVVGATKIMIAVLLIAGFWFPFLVYPASLVLAMLMVGAIAMHIKVRDPYIRTMPAIIVFLMSVTNILLSTPL